jgi:hypothetical protein
VKNKTGGGDATRLATDFRTKSGSTRLATRGRVKSVAGGADGRNLLRRLREESGTDDLPMKRVVPRSGGVVTAVAVAQSGRNTAVIIVRRGRKTAVTAAPKRRETTVIVAQKGCETAVAVARRGRGAAAAGRAEQAGALAMRVRAAMPTWAKAAAAPLSRRVTATASSDELSVAVW